MAGPNSKQGPSDPVSRRAAVEEGPGRPAGHSFDDCLFEPGGNRFRQRLGNLSSPRHRTPSSPRHSLGAHSMPKLLDPGPMKLETRLQAGDQGLQGGVVVLP